MVTGIASGNGTIVIELKDSEQTVIANATILVAVNITPVPKSTFVWSIRSQKNYPYYDRGTAYAAIAGCIVDQNLNSVTLESKPITMYAYDANGDEITHIENASVRSDGSETWWWSGQQLRLLSEYFGTLTDAEIRQCKAVVTWTYDGEAETAEAFFEVYSA